MKSLVTLVALSLTTFAVACASGGDSSDDTGGAAADLSAASANASLSGTFEAAGTNDLAKNSFTFNANHTYKAMGGCFSSGSNSPHCFAITEETGTWKIAKSGPELGAPGGATELVLTNDLDHQARTFFLTLTNDGHDLALATVFNGTAARFTKDDGPTSNTTSAKDTLVGTWADTKDDVLLFHSLTLKTDSTFSSQGGCRPQQGCFAITEQHGTWKLALSGPQLGAPAGAQELVLTDSSGTTTLFFTLDASGKELDLGKGLVGDRGHFTKE